MMKQALYLALLALVLFVSGTTAAEDEAPEFLRRELAKKTCDICPLVTLDDVSCSGFKIKTRELWGSFAKKKDDGSYDNEDCDQRCCTTIAGGEDSCCEDYPAGYYVAFALGVLGLVAMLGYCVYYAVFKKKAESEEKE